jgi:DNA-directed RNA polymerase subunit E'/Rpb7
MVSQKQLLTTNLNIIPSRINENIDTVIYSKLKNQLEGMCFQDGYVIPDTIEIVKRSLGKIVNHNNQSFVRYSIQYTADIISPQAGDEINAYIQNITKMGVIAYIKLGKSSFENLKESPLLIIIPREYFKDSVVNIDNLVGEQEIKVEVVGARVKFQSQQIQVVAKPI